MDAIEYAKKLISFPSVSRDSNVAVTDYVEQALRNLGFETERVDYQDENGTAKSNVIGKRGTGKGGLAYFGHTDVVPADDWSDDSNGPFDPLIKNGRLYGRGSCDMKGSVACFLAAADRAQKFELESPIFFTCTADEEVGYGGASSVAERSEFFREMVRGQTHAIIGEPTMLDVVYAHKGVCGFRVTSHGRAAHSSTREGLNANLAMIPFLSEMKAIHDETNADQKWQNHEFDPPSISWNIGINDFTYAVNITAPQSVCTVYFRPMPGQDDGELIDRVKSCAARHGLDFEMRVRCSPLYIESDSPYVREALNLVGREQPRTVAYGTDGCQFTELKNIIVLGPGDIAQAHTADEWIDLEQLERGTDIYEHFIRRFCGTS